MQTRSVTTVVTAPAGIAVDGGRPLEISVSFGSARVTQNYDPAHGNQLKHDFPANDGARRTEPVDITLRETLPDGQFRPFGIRWKAPIEPLYDIRVSALLFHEIGNCDSGSPVDPVIRWTNPAGVSNATKLDVGPFDNGSAVMNNFASTWNASGASRGLTEPGILWGDDDPLGDPGAGTLSGWPARGTPLLPGATHKIHKTLPAASVAPARANSATASPTNCSRTSSDAARSAG